MVAIVVCNLAHCSLSVHARVSQSEVVARANSKVAARREQRVLGYNDTYDGLICYLTR